MAKIRKSNFMPERPVDTTSPGDTDISGDDVMCIYEALNRTSVAFLTKMCSLHLIMGKYQSKQMKTFYKTNGLFQSVKAMENSDGQRNGFTLGEITDVTTNAICDLRLGSAPTTHVPFPRKPLVGQLVKSEGYAD